MMVMCFNASVNARTLSSSWKRNTSGKLSSKLSKASKLSMRWESSTEIWRVPTYSSTKIRLQNSVISMSPKLQRRDSSTRRLVHHIMQVQRCGKISHMTWNLIYGLLDVSSMRCVLWYLHSGLMTWMDYSRKSSRVSTHLSQVTTLWTWECWSRHFYRSIQHRDQLQSRLLRCQ